MRRATPDWPIVSLSPQARPLRSGKQPPLVLPARRSSMTAHSKHGRIRQTTGVAARTETEDERQTTQSTQQKQQKQQQAPWTRRGEPAGR